MGGTLVGCPALVVDAQARTVQLGKHLLYEGDPLCLDGDTGAVYSEALAAREERAP
jgi:phosphoenolpyruvate synthase/pyruvate phosphate dikinase